MSAPPALKMTDFRTEEPRGAASPRHGAGHLDAGERRLLGAMEKTSMPTDDLECTSGGARYSPMSIYRWCDGRPKLLCLFAFVMLGPAACAGLGPPGFASMDKAGTRWDPKPDYRLGADRFGAPVRPGFDKPPTYEWWDKTLAQTPRMMPHFEKPGPEGKGRWAAASDGVEPAVADYSVDSGFVAASAAGTMESRVPKSAPWFRFAAFGDTRDGHAVHQAIIDAIVPHHPDFFIHTGDMVTNGGLVGEWQRFFDIERPLLISCPIIAAIGNHDVSRTGLFERYFLGENHVGTPRYYSRDWGNLRVVVLDPTTEMRRGSDQYAAVSRMLDQGARRGMLMVMVTHEPPYSSGKHGSDPVARQVVTELAERYGVELVLSGHDHEYERSRKINGVTYVVTAGGGAPSREVKARSFTAMLRTEAHYLLIDVRDGSLTLHALNLKGDVFDEDVIYDNPPRSES